MPNWTYMAQPADVMEELRKWHGAKTAVKVVSADEIDGGIFETPARVLYVDQSSLILISIEDAPQTRKIDLQTAKLLIPESVKCIKIIWPDGKNTVIFEA